MSDLDFVVLDVGTLKEFLEDVPDEYSVTVEEFEGSNLPVMSFDTVDEWKEFVLKPGDMNEG
jgi:hypothetical protein